MLCKAAENTTAVEDESNEITSPRGCGRACIDRVVAKGAHGRGTRIETTCWESRTGTGWRLVGELELHAFRHQCRSFQKTEVPCDIYSSFYHETCNAWSARRKNCNHFWHPICDSQGLEWENPILVLKCRTAAPIFDEGVCWWWQDYVCQFCSMPYLDNIEVRPLIGGLKNIWWCGCACSEKARDLLYDMKNERWAEPKLAHQFGLRRSSKT